MREEVKGKALQRQDGQEEREYVLDPAPPPLTLAQKMGLVASPAGRLTEDEWTQVKARSVLQGESVQPCAICREEFCLQPQTIKESLSQVEEPIVQVPAGPPGVLLSCSHVFHRACLQAFERFTGRKCCPMCRREQYETRVIHDAARLFRHQCATRIQACWRGYVARKWYKNTKKTICPKDKRLRRKFFEAKCSQWMEGLDFEACVAFMVALRKREHCHLVNLPQLRPWMTKQDTARHFFQFFIEDDLQELQAVQHSADRRVFQQLERKQIPEPQENDWDRIQSQVIHRGVWDCPICLTALYSPNLTTEAGGSNQQQQRRRTVLLSCSHLFHQLCLEAFEAFTADSRPTCPLCRSVYHKKVI
ncbi:hypothetical protein PAMP_011117 [Pampus punctatissimus]